MACRNEDTPELSQKRLFHSQDILIEPFIPSSIVITAIDSLAAEHGSERPTRLSAQARWNDGLGNSCEVEEIGQQQAVLSSLPPVNAKNLNAFDRKQFLS